MANVAKDFAQLISQSKSNKTGPYDTQATVKRVEGNTVWVSIPGGVDETPIDKTVNCTAGDKVQVRVSGGRAWITGNASAPPTDDTTAIKARTTATEAQVLAVDAKETADAVEGIAVNANTTAVSAKAIAEGVNEHFWHDNTGAHVTEVTQEEWNEPTDPNYHFGGNTLITTQGMAIRNGLVNLAEFGTGGITIGQPNTGQCITVEPTAVTFKDSGLIYANISYNTGTVIKDIPTNQKLEIGASGFTLFNYRDEGLTVNGNSVSATGDITDGSGNVLSDKADSAGFFKIVQLAVTTSSSVSAHGSYANATYTVPAGDRPAGMTLAGIVGWGASNYRLSPSTAFVNGTHSISVTLANTSASSVSSGATVNFRLLYIKATSA